MNNIWSIVIYIMCIFLYIRIISIENKLDALIATQATYIESNSCVVMKMPESDVDYYKRSGDDG